MRDWSAFIALDPGNLISNFHHWMPDKKSRFICLLETHGSCGQTWKQKVSTTNHQYYLEHEMGQNLDTRHMSLKLFIITDRFPWCSLLSDHHDVSHPWHSWHLPPSVGESLGELLARVSGARVRTRLMSSGQCGETQERFRIPVLCAYMCS